MIIRVGERESISRIVEGPGARFEGDPNCDGLGRKTAVNQGPGRAAGGMRGPARTNEGCSSGFDFHAWVGLASFGCRVVFVLR